MYKCVSCFSIYLDKNVLARILEHHKAIRLCLAHLKSALIDASCLLCSISNKQISIVYLCHSYLFTGNDSNNRTVIAAGEEGESITDGFLARNGLVVISFPYAKGSTCFFLPLLNYFYTKWSSLITQCIINPFTNEKSKTLMHIIAK